jgi:hypothetical protein
MVQNSDATPRTVGTVEASSRSIMVSRAIIITPSLHGGTPVWCRLGLYLPSAIRACVHSRQRATLATAAAEAGPCARLSASCAS